MLPQLNEHSRVFGLTMDKTFKRILCAEIHTSLYCGSKFQCYIGVIHTRTCCGISELLSVYSNVSKRIFSDLSIRVVIQLQQEFIFVHAGLALLPQLGSYFYYAHNRRHLLFLNRQERSEQLCKTCLKNKILNEFKCS